MGVPEPISIHAPLTGCDDRGSYNSGSRRYFNPRTPRGVRRGDSGAAVADGAISIHAPLAGCDHPARCSSRQGHHFNPRTPCGVRPCQVHLPLCPQHISIHAPLVGCDGGDFDPDKTRVLFQSTHPLRGATIYPTLIMTLVTISIHAPLTGCDDRGSCNSGSRRYFNPRTPCGVRPPERIPPPIYRAFQSTHPLRGVTAGAELLAVPGLISIHAPLAGCMD